MTMLDFSQLVDETPEWARECFYCHPDDLGAYDERRHLANHLPMTCDSCGEVGVNSLIYSMSHGANPRMHSRYSIRTVLCMSAWLRMNHLVYDLYNGKLPTERDLTVLEQLQLFITPDGDFVPRPPDSERSTD